MPEPHTPSSRTGGFSRNSRTRGTRRKRGSSSKGCAGRRPTRTGRRRRSPRMFPTSRAARTPRKRGRGCRRCGSCRPSSRGRRCRSDPGWQRTPPLRAAKRRKKRSTTPTGARLATPRRGGNISTTSMARTAGKLRPTSTRRCARRPSCSKTRPRCASWATRRLPIDSRTRGPPRSSTRASWRSSRAGRGRSPAMPPAIWRSCGRIHVAPRCWRRPPTSCTCRARRSTSSPKRLRDALCGCASGPRRSTARGCTGCWRRWLRRARRSRSPRSTAPSRCSRRCRTPRPACARRGSCSRWRRSPSTRRS